jgi:hypothetical protein
VSTVARPRRLGALAISTGLIVFGAAGMAGAGQEFVSGSGRARASIFEIVLRTGGLSIPVTFGRSVVSFQGSEAQAASNAQGPPHGEPPAPPKAPGSSAQPAAECGGGGANPSSNNPFASNLQVSSFDKPPYATASFMASPSYSPIQGAMQRQEVEAGRQPSGRAVTIGGDIAFPGGLIEGLRSKAEATTGVVDGNARVSHSVVTLDRLSLANGSVVLHGMRWEATQRTGESGNVEVVDGSFTFGGASVGNTPLPGGSGGEQVFAGINQALAQTGLAIVPPVIEKEGGTARVSPLSVRMADSPLGRQAIGPLLGNLQPIREPLAQGLLNADCRFGALLTVADVALGVISGSGAVSFDFGGVSATSEGARFDNPLAGPIGDDLGAPGDDVVLPPSSAEEVALPASGPLPPEELAAALPTGTTPAGDYPAGSVPPEDLLAAPSQPAPAPASLGPASSRLPGRKGGAALAVGIVGLLAVLFLAAADAVHIRRASRSIP